MRQPAEPLPHLSFAVTPPKPADGFSQPTRCESRIERKARSACHGRSVHLGLQPEERRPADRTAAASSDLLLSLLRTDRQ
jgi:hypothetical protein